ncbi:Stf0 family sulfotransferase [Microlunatus sp. Gsoil 973]|uniref:Stf0 family sulfotransferase n=1 Tax=Microlunatus sp. Gsoil 973 TaxID=2672569 RepID=UPI0012B4FFC2|nr:Stf0 family sulfotransferase [Microlunatus sp. Gsoil 973]QGN33252.1 Stf0 sulfotransferase [Microlunatus sp. Gsoil 973]
MIPPGLDSYLICATPRTGSTLLCGLLRSSGVAGHPASYFNRRGLHSYAERWQMVRPHQERIDEAYLRAALDAGTTPNGVFGGRIMAESLPELLADLSALSQSSANDLELLSSRFGRVEFVHLRRRDVVAQAVSWAKALQTHYWHPDEEVLPGGRPPEYDEALIGRLAGAIQDFESAWNRWFSDQRIVPYEVVYEQLAADPVGTAHRVLDHLGLEVPAGRELVVTHHRQADEINADWAGRFRDR